MKKVFILILLSVLMLTGCAVQSDSLTVDADDSVNDEGTSTTISASKTDDSEPAQSASIESDVNEPVQTGAGLNYTEIDLYGEISELIGNEITIKVMERPATSNGGQGNQNTTGVPREKNYTGEEVDIIIPVGTPIFTKVKTGQGTGQPSGEPGTSAGTGPAETEISFNEIQTGWTIQIFYMEDGLTIEKVVVQKPGGSL